MPDFVRVRDRQTGHEYTVPLHRFIDEAHVQIDKPALGRDGLPAPAKPRSRLVPQAKPRKRAQARARGGRKAATAATAPTSIEVTPDPVPAADVAPEANGHQANTEKEND